MKRIEGPLELTISSYSDKGDGRAKLSPKYRCDVLGALEGEVANVQIIKRRGRLFTAKIVELLSSSEHRIKPLCAHASLCGGCRLQHLRYVEQLKIKEEELKKIFDSPLLPIIPCDFPFYMRNKMEFSFEEGKIGLIEGGSKGRVLDLDECHICPKTFIPLLKKVKQWWQKYPMPAFHSRSGEGILRSLMIRSSRSCQMQVVLTVMQPLAREEEEQLIKHLDDPSLSLFIQVHHAKKGMRSYFELFLLKGEPRLKETFELSYQGVKNRFELAVSPPSFLQPNPIQAEKMYQAVLDLLMPKGDEVVLDLFAGVGAFGRTLAPFVKQVMSVEIVKNSLEDANATSLASNMEFFCEEASLWFKNYKGEVDIVVVDPPRAGLEKGMLEQLLAVGAREIVYISCNIATQARDLKDLFVLYEIAKVQPVDQFPHTMHLENIVLLKKKSVVI